MELKDTPKKLRELFGKAGKKTIIATAAIAVLGCVVALSFLLNNTAKENGKRKLAIDLKSEGNQVTTGESVDYFASVSLERRQARDEAVEVLKTVSENENALEEAKAAAQSDIDRIALDIEREANIESLIQSKGFEQCVAVISDNACSVIVESNGLLQSEVAQISEIVYEQAGILPENLKIVEKAKN